MAPARRVQLFPIQIGTSGRGGYVTIQPGTGASVSGKKLFVEGQNFDVGAKIILNDEKQKTANDEPTLTTVLVGKKAGNWIGLGETVRLKVRNSDGTESAEFSYTRTAG